jgi:hypothetical protein
MSISRLGMLVTQDLIDDLNKLFPDTCIKKGQSLEDAHAVRGHREVIDKLQDALREFEVNQKVL